MRWVSGWRRSLFANWITGLTILLAAMAALLWFTWTSTRAHERTDARNGLRHSAQSIAVIADDLFREGVVLGSAIALDADIQSLDPERFLPRLREYAALSAQFDAFMVLDRTGLVLGSTAPPDAGSPTSLADRPFVGRVLQQGEPTTIRVDAPRAGRAIGTGVAAPVRDARGDIRGILVLTINLERLNARLSQIPLPPGQTLALLDPNGRLAMTMGAAAPALSTLTWDQRDRSSLPEVQAALRGETVVTDTFRGPTTGHLNMAAFTPTPRYGWVVAATWPEDAALADSRLIAQQQMLGFGIVVFLVILRVRSVLATTVLPLRRLVHHTEQLRQGHFTPISRISNQDEIGLLAQTFNRMGAELQQTVRDLDAERARLASILEHLPVGVVVVSAADGKVVHANAIAIRLRSPSADGHQTYDPTVPSGLFHADGRPYQSDERPLARALRDGTAAQGEELFLRLPNEPERLLSVNTLPIKDDAGEIVTVIQTFEDVTNRRLADLRMRQHDEMLSTLFTQFPGALTVIDRDFRLQVAVSGAHFADFPTENVVGKRIDEVFPPPFAAAVRTQVIQALAGETVVVDIPVGDDIYNQIVCPLKDADGAINRVLSVRTDITRQRQLAARLRDREEILQALIDQFPGSITVVDRHYRVVMVGGQRYFAPHISNEALIGQPMAANLTEAEFQVYRTDAERAFAGEAVSLNRQVQGRIMRGTITPMRDVDGAIETVLNVAFDVTDEVARLERSSRDEKLRVLGQMASGIAHDLNQALTLMTGYGELARDALKATTPDVTSAREMIQIMERAAYDGGETVKRLLTFARGGADEQPQQLDVSVLLHEVEQLTAPRWRGASQAHGDLVSLRVDAAPGLTVNGSQSALRELLTNLIFNALDAMPNGGTMTLAARQADGRVLIDVTDTGSGMPPEVQARVFEPFFTTKGQAGTGLGLAMVFGIVQRHQGEIDITSAVGVGTTFHLSFPVGEATALPSADGEGLPPARPCRILVVDDEAMIGRLALSMLKREGHEAEHAMSGEAALDRLARASFDLVITDLSMGSGMNGWQLAAAIQDMPQPVPVVLATGWGAGIDNDEARTRGVVAVLSKPYRRAELQAAVSQVLSAGGSATPAVAVSA